MLTLFAFYLLIVSSTAGNIKIIKCRNDKTKVRFNVAGIADNPEEFKLVIGQTYNYTISFKAEIDTPSIKNKPRLQLYNVEDEYDALPGVTKDGCKILKTPGKCPIKMGTEYTLVDHFNIPSSYRPMNRAQILWQIDAKNNSTMVCFSANANIVQKTN